MITQEQVKGLLKNYDMSKITIGCLGGHSALDVCAGAKSSAFQQLQSARKEGKRHIQNITGEGKGLDLLMM